SVRDAGSASPARRALRVRAVRRSPAQILQPRRDAGTDAPAMTTRSYIVVHETNYEYEHPVGLSRQILHLTPRATSFQSCRAHALDVSPRPDTLASSTDPFGNPMSSLCIEADHDSLSIRAESWVDVNARKVPADASTPAWDEVRSRLV